MKKEIEKLKESITSDDESEYENDAIILKENLRRRELKRNKVMIQSPSIKYTKQKSFKDILAKDLKDMADETYKKAKLREIYKEKEKYNQISIKIR